VLGDSPTSLSGGIECGKALAPDACMYDPVPWYGPSRHQGSSPCTGPHNGFHGAATPRRGRELVRGNGTARRETYITVGGPAYPRRHRGARLAARHSASERSGSCRERGSGELGSKTPSCPAPQHAVLARTAGKAAVCRVDMHLTLATGRAADDPGQKERQTE
jgi:hypothetical protein